MLMRDFREGEDVYTPSGRRAKLVERHPGDLRGIVRWSLRYEDDGSAGLVADHQLKPAYRSGPVWKREAGAA
jgi:hypothetical protein